MMPPFQPNDASHHPEKNQALSHFRGAFEILHCPISICPMICLMICPIICPLGFDLGLESPRATPRSLVPKQIPLRLNGWYRSRSQPCSAVHIVYFHVSVFIYKNLTAPSVQAIHNQFEFSLFNVKRYSISFETSNHTSTSSNTYNSLDALLYFASKWTIQLPPFSTLSHSAMTPNHLYSSVATRLLQIG
jgi:hypothetical protein